jgi:predicted CoA-binding protein
VSADPVDVLRRFRRIAVVGCSATPGKDAHEIPKYMLHHGYDIVPVNPTGGEILGRRAYPRLADVPGPVDVVDVFRPPAEAPEVARQAVAIGAKVLWLQLGIRSAEARQIAQDAGLLYVEDRCLKVEHRRL